MRHSTWLWLALMLLLPTLALAQMDMFGGAIEDEEPAPSEELPALPDAVEQPAPTTTQTQPQGQSGMTMEFPQLPPSRLCTKREILGMWKLAMVFQTPRGAELDDFGNYPYQYMLVNDNNTYRSYKSQTDENTAADVVRILQEKSNVLEQFVVNESGVLYQYKDSAAVNSYACFIVVNPIKPFAEGQMLLMPPPERAHIRMVKVYQKVYSAPGGDNKKKNNRRTRQRKQQ